MHLVNYFLICLISLMAFAANANDRIALVIANSNYREIGALVNPVSDAKLIYQSLVAIGYQSKILIDADELTLRKEIRQFSALSEQSSLALIFYAGHGAQVNGENYILPIDIGIPKTESDIHFSSINVNDVLNSLKSKTKVIFLDACRDNPALIKSLSKGRGAYPSGLAPAAAGSVADRSSGVFIAYATDSGNVALDGAGQTNSPFTTALARHIGKPISIDDMFSLVTKDVLIQTKHKQKPYKYASLSGVICLTRLCGNSDPSVNFSATAQVDKSNVASAPLTNAEAPNHFVLYSVGEAPVNGASIKPKSIASAGDRLKFRTRFQYKIPPPGVNSKTKFMEMEWTVNCAQKDKGAISWIGFLDSEEKSLLEYQLGLPDVIPLNIDFPSFSQGSIASALACTPSLLKQPLNGSELNGASWIPIVTIKEGIDLHYLKDSVSRQSTIVSVIVKLVFLPTPLNELKERLGFSSGLYDGLDNAPKVIASVARMTFNCVKNTYIEGANYLYDERDTLIAYSSYGGSLIGAAPIESISASHFAMLSKHLCNKV
jgi:hypothetical protein